MHEISPRQNITQAVSKEISYAQSVNMRRKGNLTFLEMAETKNGYLSTPKNLQQQQQRDKWITVQGLLNPTTGKKIKKDKSCTFLFLQNSSGVIIRCAFFQVLMLGEYMF